MEKLIQSFKKISRLLVIICLLVYAGFLFIFNIIGIDGELFPVLAGLLDMLFVVALFALPAVLLLMKKDNEAKFVFLILAAYWILNLIENFIAQGAGINKYNQAMNVVVDIFELILGLALATVLVLYILTKVFNLKLFKIARLILFVSLACFALVFILKFIDCIIDKDPWTDYLNALVVLLALPLGMISGIFYWLDEEQPEEPKKEENKEEPKEEKPEEVNEEEKPAEETKEEVVDEETKEEKLEE